MRSSAALFLIAAVLLPGYALKDRFAAPEQRLNEAVPPDAGVQTAWQSLQAQVADQPAARKAIEPMWTARLRLRALTCSRDATPGWRDSAADIRARHGGSSCLAEQDRLLQRWLGLQRVRLLLAQGPLLAVPADPPSVLGHREQISAIAAAPAAPVAIVHGSSGFDIVSLSNGKSLFRETQPVSQGTLQLAPNGRLFSQSVGDKVLLRATAGGETLVELGSAGRFFWLDESAVFLRGSGSGAARLLDLASGEESPLPGSWSGYTEAVAPVPGAPHRFNLLSSHYAYQIEIEKEDGRLEARLLLEKQGQGGQGYGPASGGLSSDGTNWITSAKGLRLVNLESLDFDETDFAPVGVQGAWPTSDPQQFVVTLQLASSDRPTSPARHYLYDRRNGTLAALTLPPGARQRFQYLAVIQRLALIEGDTVRLLAAAPAAQPRPVSAVVNEYIDEVNQRRLAAAIPMPATAQAGVTLPGVTLPTAAALGAAQIEGVGVYEGQGAPRGVGMARQPGTVEVRVRRSARPIALVLSSYEPVRWFIVSESGARLAAVLISGYHESTVVGAGSAPVYQIGQTHAYQFEGAGFAELQRSVMRWTGRPMATFQGRYQGGNFAVGGGS